MSRPWWWLRSRPDATVELADPGPDKVRVPTHLDVWGEPDEWTWCEPDTAAAWDVNSWRNEP